MNFVMNKYTKVFETFVLKPLWIIYLMGMIFSFVQQEWFIGGFLLLVLFYLGWVGGGVVNKGKTFKELTKGTLPEKWSSLEDGTRDGSTPLRLELLSEAAVYTSYAVALTIIIVLLKYGYGFYISIPIGLVVAFLFKEVSVFYTIFMTSKLKHGINKIMIIKIIIEIILVVVLLLAGFYF